MGLMYRCLKNWGQRDNFHCNAVPQYKQTWDGKPQKISQANEHQLILAAICIWIKCFPFSNIYTQGKPSVHRPAVSKHTVMLPRPVTQEALKHCHCGNCLSQDATIDSLFGQITLPFKHPSQGTESEGELVNLRLYRLILTDHILI